MNEKKSIAGVAVHQGRHMESPSLQSAGGAIPAEGAEEPAGAIWRMRLSTT